VENAPSTWRICLPPLLLVIVLALVIGHTRASSAQDSGGIRVADDAEELNGFARLGLLDGKPERRIDLRVDGDDP
jgi:hypothetical protein